MTGEEMAVKLAETEARSKSNTHRIDHLEKSTEAITVSYTHLTLPTIA